MPPRIIARTFLQLGLILTGAALVSAEAAWLHMRELVRTYGAICGSGSGVMAHCPACYASLSFLAAAATAFILAHAKDPAAPLRRRSNPSA